MPRSMEPFGKVEFEQGHGSRFQRFQDLMRFRVREILLVSSLYDSFILAEDGSLYESLLSEYIGLGLTHMPNLTRVPSGKEALELAKDPRRFDLIITSLRLGDMHAVEFAEQLKQVGVETPVVLLTYDSRELNQLVRTGNEAIFDKVFIWQGDFRVFLAIIKFIEDRMNIQHDTELIGVQSIILIEDSVKFYSSYLPLIYTAVLEHTEELISEGVNSAHKLLRMRARPKIILCSNYEEAWHYFQTYHGTILGVISDIEFPRAGMKDREAGFEFARNVRAAHRDIPVLLQSQNAVNKKKAEETGAWFLQKGSATLLHELKQFMIQHFGFGDFVFRLRDGTVVGRASDLRGLEEQLYVVPDESLAYHGERNDFSTWLKSRTEFLLAHRLRPKRIADFKSIAEVREHLIRNLRLHRQEQQTGSIVDFDPDAFDETVSYARIGGGSLGGKARGLGFANALFDAYRIQERIQGARILVPPAVILGTDVFDGFLDDNGLRDFALRTDDDDELLGRFSEANFPEIVAEALNSFLYTVRLPLAVRSSSLLEDSQFMPFAGVYETFMLANNHEDPRVRLNDLLSAIKRVYASMFSRAAKTYLKSTPYRLEEEKMAVIIQKLAGARHENRFYPDLAGVARSHNFYPIRPMKPDDGIASIAMGLGKTVVEGGACVRFCPKFPRHLVQFSKVEDILKYSQTEFFALKLPPPDADPDEVERAHLQLEAYGLDVAEQDGVLDTMGSTYSIENHAIYDGITRKGPRVVTFAPMLKNDLFPLAEIIGQLLELGRRGMNGHIEIEFAVNLSVPEGTPPEFFLLQMRPMVVEQEMERLGIGEGQETDLICRSSSVLGNGIVRNVRDLVVVDGRRYDRSQSLKVASEVRAFNADLVGGHTPYLLIGVGRWGSADPWLGIPVRWEDICGARVIVEAGMRDVKVAPSQGTHFFQNITATKVGYLTVNSDSNSFVDWEWLETQPAVGEKQFTRHLRFEEPVDVIMDGHRGEAIITKPGMVRS